MWPLYNGIELQKAGRLERYESTGTNGNPSLGLTVTPASIVGRNQVARVLRDLRLRGHFASSFRAPSIYQTFNGFVTTLDQFGADREGIVEDLNGDQGSRAFCWTTHWLSVQSVQSGPTKSGAIVRSSIRCQRSQPVVALLKISMYGLSMTPR